MFKSLEILSGQTAFDIAVQEFGSVEGVFELLAANPGLRIDSAIPSGTVLRIEGEPLNKPVVDYYVQNQIRPATGNTAGQVDYMETDTNKNVEM